MKRRTDTYRYGGVHVIIKKLDKRLTTTMIHVIKLLLYSMIKVCVFRHVSLDV